MSYAKKAATPNQINTGWLDEAIYSDLVAKMPIFCLDFLVTCKSNHLLIKRIEHPLKDTFWVIGGRMRYQETFFQCCERIQTREIGRYIGAGKIIGFSNYLFERTDNSRALHTPTLLFQVFVENEFKPTLDSTSSDFAWTRRLPDQLIRQTIFINSP